MNNIKSVHDAEIQINNFENNFHSTFHVHVFYLNFVDLLWSKQNAHWVKFSFVAKLQELPRKYIICNFHCWCGFVTQLEIFQLSVSFSISLLNSIQICTLEMILNVFILINFEFFSTLIVFYTTDARINTLINL